MIILRKKFSFAVVFIMMALLTVSQTTAQINRADSSQQSKPANSFNIKQEEEVIRILRLITTAEVPSDFKFITIGPQVVDAGVRQELQARMDQARKEIHQHCEIFYLESLIHFSTEAKYLGWVKINKDTVYDVDLQKVLKNRIAVQARYIEKMRDDEREVAQMREALTVLEQIYLYPSVRGLRTVRISHAVYDKPLRKYLKHKKAEAITTSKEINLVKISKKKRERTFNELELPLIGELLIKSSREYMWNCDEKNLRQADGVYTILRDLSFASQAASLYSLKVPPNLFNEDVSEFLEDKIAIKLWMLTELEEIERLEKEIYTAGDVNSIDAIVINVGLVDERIVKDLRIEISKRREFLTRKAALQNEIAVRKQVLDSIKQANPGPQVLPEINSRGPGMRDMPRNEDNQLPFSKDSPLFLFRRILVVIF